MGLIPLGGPVASLTTVGLRWDVSAWPTSFGGAVSSSNHALACDAWVAQHGTRWWRGVQDRMQGGGADDEVQRKAGQAVQMALERGTPSAAEGGPEARVGAEDGVSVTCSQSIVWTGTIDAEAVIAAWCAAGRC